jgi:hypothetical protein
LKRQAAASAITSHLTFVDKSPVIEVGLIRRKIAKDPIGSIRCKFSIDAELWRRALRVPHPPI